jgi:enoyl-[acyl-carrier protein] reductase I
MGLFDNKKGLIVGVANDHSIAWAIAKYVMDEGGQCGFTYLPDRPDDERQRNRRRVAQITDPEPNATFLVPMDVNDDAQIAQVMQQTAQQFGKIDFLLHSVAFAPLEDLKCDTVRSSRAGFKVAMEISAYSLIGVTQGAIDILAPNASVLTMTYFGGERAVPGYNLMGVCKAALDSIVKYLAYDLGPRGVRVNAVSAGPLRTLAGRGAGVDDMLILYEKMAPLGRNITHDEVAHAGGFLLSDKASGITGEILHVDAGYNIMGSPGRMAEEFRPAAQ